MLRNYHHLVRLCTVFFALFPQCSNPAGIIIHLNGTSSAGKSSIAQELQKQLPSHCFTVVSYDGVAADVFKALAAEASMEIPTNASLTSLNAMLKNVSLSNEQIGQRIDEEVYSRTKKLVNAGSHVILDRLVEDEADACLYQKNLFGLPVLRVLVHCSPAKLVQHVEKRNQNVDADEHRELYGVIAQFYSMYQLQQSHEQAVDVLDTSATKALLSTVINEAPSSVSSSEKLEMLKLFTQKFKLDEQVAVNIASFFSFDVLVNSGTTSPQECAQIIITKLSKKSI